MLDMQTRTNSTNLIPSFPRKHVAMMNRSDSANQLVLTVNTQNAMVL